MNIIDWGQWVIILYHGYLPHMSCRNHTIQTNSGSVMIWGLLITLTSRKVRQTYHWWHNLRAQWRHHVLKAVPEWWLPSDWAQSRIMSSDSLFQWDCSGTNATCCLLCCQLGCLLCRRKVPRHHAHNVFDISDDIFVHSKDADEYWKKPSSLSASSPAEDSGEKYQFYKRSIKLFDHSFTEPRPIQGVCHRKSPTRHPSKQYKFPRYSCRFEFDWFIDWLIDSSILFKDRIFADCIVSYFDPNKNTETVVDAKPCWPGCRIKAMRPLQEMSLLLLLWPADHWHQWKSDTPKLKGKHLLPHETSYTTTCMCTVTISRS